MEVISNAQCFRDPLGDLRKNGVPLSLCNDLCRPNLRMISWSSFFFLFFFVLFCFYHLLCLLSSGGRAFNKLKKVGKTTRPFRYDVNPIPYDYTVDVRNRFKGLDLTDRVPAELWTEVVTLYRRQGLRPSPWKRNRGTYTCMTSPKFN